MMTWVQEVFNNDLSRLILAVLLIGGTILLLVMHEEVPLFLAALDGAAVGFYFGGLAGIKTPTRG